MAMESLPDAITLSSLVPMAEDSGWWTTNQDPAPIPPPVVRQTWTGAPLDLRQVNAGNESEYIPPFEDEAIGSDLRVAHAYGIDILEIEIADETPLIITVQGDLETQFRTAIVSEENASWTHTLFSQSITVRPTVSTTRIRIVITRSEPGTGEYEIALRPGE